MIITVNYRNISLLYQQNTIYCSYSNRGINMKTIIAELSKEQIEFIKQKQPDIVEKIQNNHVIMWEDRLEHIKKHRMDFQDIYEFDDYVSQIPEIIKNPDYIGFKDKDNSLQFIKEMADNILVAVRVTNNGELSFRTMFKITDSQLNDYVRKGTAWKYKNKC